MSLPHGGQFLRLGTKGAIWHWWSFVGATTRGFCLRRSAGLGVSGKGSHVTVPHRPPATGRLMSRTRPPTRHRGRTVAQRLQRSLATAAIVLLIASAPAAALTPEHQGWDQGWDPAAEPLEARVPVPTAARLQALAASVPADPFAAASALVTLAFDPDPAAGSSAVAEILRRTGIPIVSPDGPVVAMPDGFVLADAATYDASVADLARAVRRGDSWVLSDVVAGLKGAEFIAEFVEPEQLAAAVGDLGKGLDDPDQVRFAGAVIRALSGRRGEVLYSASSPSTAIDPLQFMLLLSLWTSDAYARVVPGARVIGAVARLPGLDVATTAADPCADLAGYLDTGVGRANQDVNKELVKAGLKRAVPPSLGDPVGPGYIAWDKGTSVLSTILLLLGTSLELDSDKTSTHFKHRGGDRGPHVHLTATATFDSALAQNRLKCYKLAGISVPPNGPIKGFRIQWSIDQPQGAPYTRYGVGGSQPNPFPLIVDGLFLKPTSADSSKIGRGGEGGQITGMDGRSTLELYPPVETKPGQGRTAYGKAIVTAALSKDDVPRLLKVTDPYSLIKVDANGQPVGQAAWAVQRTLDLALSYLNHAGLPSRHTTIRVGYHGVDIYVVKGSGTAFLFFYVAPYSVDLYVCDGLRRAVDSETGQDVGGRWRGEARFSGDRFIDPAWMNGVLGAARSLFGGIPPDAPSLPATIRGENLDVDQVINALDTDTPQFIKLIEPYMEGLITIDRPPPEELLTGPEGTVLNTQHVNRAVGEIELFLGEQSLDELGRYMGMGSARFTIYGVPKDDRCPGGGPDDYYFEGV